MNKHRDDDQMLKQHLLQLGRQFLADGRLAEAWKMRRRGRCGGVEDAEAWKILLPLE